MNRPLPIPAENQSIPSAIVLGADAAGSTQVSMLRAGPSASGGECGGAPGPVRIFHRGKCFSYPLRPFEVVRNLGVAEAIRSEFSALRARLFPIARPRNFAQWASNRFGWRLSRTLFQPYAEKFWGMPMGKTLASGAAPCLEGGTRAGEAAQSGRTVTGCHFEATSRRWQIVHRDAEGRVETALAARVISSLPIRELAAVLSPAPSAEFLEAASALKYRDVVTVRLVSEEALRFAEGPLLVAEPRVQVGRIQSVDPEAAGTCFGSGRFGCELEYFCREGDKVWSLPDAQLVELASFELEWLGLIGRGKLRDGSVVRRRKVLPLPTLDFARNMRTICAEAARVFPSLQLVACRGMAGPNESDDAPKSGPGGAVNRPSGDGLSLSSRRSTRAWRGCASAFSS
jgi:protoporphyrinogen oxidase